MEPEIRYARTSDGVNIAYAVVGSGPPLVAMDLPTSNVRYEWQIDSLRAMHESTARVATFIRYDHRCFGLSDRPPGALTTEGFVRDLEAVVDKLELERFFLIAGRGPTYPIALHYAKAHPGRILRLAAVLGGPPMDFVNAMMATPGADWDFTSEAIARRILGWNDEGAVDLARLVRASVDAERFTRFNQWFAEARAPDDLGSIAVPTLFLAYTGGSEEAIETARELAAAMPDASILPMPDEPMEQRMQRLQATLAAFFGDATGPTPSLQQRRAAVPHGTAVILFTDIADSTALTERFGDAAFRAAARTLDERMRAAMRECAGTPVEGKVLGDGVMAVFASAAQAIDAARRCVALSAESELRLHVGLHAGDVIREDGNVYGGAVNIAARICGLSERGEILVSGTIRDLARTSAGVGFDDRGEQALKGVEEPVRIFAVR
jgi:class 3 adenylate cyclase/pimeloyl-ACP methyl ester carboxylesterase